MAIYGGIIRWHEVERGIEAKSDRPSAPAKSWGYTSIESGMMYSSAYRWVISWVKVIRPLA